MARLVSQDVEKTSEAPALLRSVAEELKLPLMQIARRAELAQITGADSQSVVGDLGATAGDALRLIDSYLLGLELAERQQMLELEPVSLPAVLYDTTQDLHNIAKHYEVKIQLQVKGTLGPVMAHRSALTAALLSLGNVFIEAQPALPASSRTVTLAVYKGSCGPVAGIYSQATAISPAELKLACRLYHRARQPINHFSAGGAAGIFVANSILQAMATRLRTSHHQHQSGLGIVLLTSNQLQLV